MFLLLLAACTPSDTPADTAVDPNAVQYNRDVAPILRENCVGCHQAGAIGPFGLENYEEVSLLANQVLDSVEQRRMPPYLADASGECNDYHDAKWLSEDEIGTIRDWVDDGLVEGNPADHPGPPAALPELEEVTHSLELEEVQVAFASGDDAYRCFVVDPGLVDDGFLTGFEVLPGNPEIVHHLIVYEPSDEAALARAYELDDEDGAPGYTCFGDARVDSTMVASWAPGTSVNRYPEGTGIQMKGGMPVVVQMHYNNASDDHVDATRVDLQVEPSVETELLSFFWVDGSLNIPPGEEAHSEESVVKLSDIGVPISLKLWSVAPHMHKLGRSEQAWIEHEDGSETCLLDVPRWDFNWQLAYTFAEPVLIEPTDAIGMRCTYDSTSATETTHWGDGTDDEMCLLTMFVSL